MLTAARMSWYRPKSRLSTAGHRAAMSSAGLMVTVPHGSLPLFGLTGIVTVPRMPLATRRALPPGGTNWYEST